MLPLLYKLLVILVIWNARASHTPTLTLNDGYEIPVVSLGTQASLKYPERIVQAVTWALEAGYRHIDTAAYYGNEELVGRGVAIALKRCNLTREDLFITTKLHPLVDNGNGVLASIKASLRRLRMTYVNLFLIHLPNNVLQLSTYNDVVNIWRGMEEVRKLGLTRSIGVCNFNSTQINEILTWGNVPPAVNEIEVNPTFANFDLVAFCQGLNITVLGYGPLGFLVPRPFRPDVVQRPPPTFYDPFLLQLAEKYQVTTSQILLRYMIERGIVILPKSSSRYHARLNIDLFHFSLTRREVIQINNFNLDQKLYIFDRRINYLAEYLFNTDFLHALMMTK